MRALQWWPSICATMKVSVYYKGFLKESPLRVKLFTWMAVRPLGKSTHQAILRGQDETPVLVKVGVLEHV